MIVWMLEEKRNGHWKLLLSYGVYKTWQTAREHYWNSSLEFLRPTRVKLVKAIAAGKQEEGK